MHEFTDIVKGSTGEDVLILQTVLSMLHYLGVDGKPLAIDGEAGTSTIFAINTFQSTMRAYGYECGTNGHNDSCFGQLCWKLLGVVENNA